MPTWFFAALKVAAIVALLLLLFLLLRWLLRKLMHRRAKRRHRAQASEAAGQAGESAASANESARQATLLAAAKPQSASEKDCQPEEAAQAFEEARQAVREAQQAAKEANKASEEAYQASSKAVDNEEIKVVAAASKEAVAAADKASQAAARAAQATERAALTRRLARVLLIMAADPLLAKQLAKMAGVAHLPLQDTSADRERVEKIARTIPEEVLETLQVSATQKEVDIDLKKEEKQSTSPFPTANIEPVRMNELEQLSSVLPEQLMQDDQAFYEALSRQELLVMQPYDRKVEHKTLAILLDVSASMGELMLNGNVPRHNWSRGITVSLLLKAVRGEATYLLRAFDGAPHKLMKATTPEEASQLIDQVLNKGLSGGGTNIFAAFRQAVADIRAGNASGLGADILIITDGEDHSMDNSQAVRELLGDDIRLHVASIGKDSPALKAVATTYRVYS